jgi:hypothetical protein
MARGPDRVREPAEILPGANHFAVAFTFRHRGEHFAMPLAACISLMLKSLSP